MASQEGSNQVIIELTESETQLRDLLLGVAAYIDETPVAEEGATGVQVPGELTKEKTVLRWTGGWVRDKLLGVRSHDIDVAINKMTGEHFGIKMLEYLKIPGNIEKYGIEQQEGTRIMTGLHKIKANPAASKNLETATIRIMGIDLDLVNLRKETYNENSRNPQMEFGTAEEDALRRDATVNAMFYNLHTMEIEDFTGRGFEDMAAKIIRTPLEPYQTFIDDPLRVLRLIRFASRLEYTIEPETETAMGNKDIQKALRVKIKRERIGDELEKMLKGPDPHRALRLIDKFGLYETIFTDPTRDFEYQPETKYFAPAYDFANEVVQNTSQFIPPVIPQTLIRNSDERYFAWICAAVMPWADAPKVPHKKRAKNPFHAAYLVAQEGFKAPNRVSEVIVASMENSEDIMKLVEQCWKEISHSKTEPNLQKDASARDTLGMAIRRWGSTWRMQLFFSLVYEIALGRVSRDWVLRLYSVFLETLTKENLLEADKFKPLINGKELAEALGTKPGPWMKGALDVVMAWQLRNPEITNPALAIEAVKKSADKTTSTLAPHLASHFLRLTIPQMFAQTKRPANAMATEGKRWKEPGNEYATDLLKYVLCNTEPEEIPRNFMLLRQPILQMMDDTDLEWKARACELITLLIKSAPPDYVVQRGYDLLFSEELWQFFTYIPSLTPQFESVRLLEHVYPALLSLIRIRGTLDENLLDRIVREGVVAPLFHLTNPMAYPELTTLIVSQLVFLLHGLRIQAVKHLQLLRPLLGNILDDPLAPAYPPLLVATAKATQSAISNCWPLIKEGEAMQMYAWVYKAWSNVRGYTHTDPRALDEAMSELKHLMWLVDELLMSLPVAEPFWNKEKRRLLKEQPQSKELFEKCKLPTNGPDVSTTETSRDN